jgi:DNA-binding GntR family transcriptional regulator
MFSHNMVIKTTNDMKKQFSVSRDEVVRANRQLVNNYGGSIKFSPEEKAVLKLIGHKNLNDSQKRDAIRRSLNEAWSRR